MARKLHAEAFDTLTALGVGREEIAAIALFRTGTPHVFSEKLLTHALALSGAFAPAFNDADWDVRAGSNFYLIRGHYCTPNYQSDIDKAPFTQAGGGRMVSDQDGTFVLQPVPSLYRADNSSESKDSECTPLMKARFVLSVPTADMPAAGWPVLVTAHAVNENADTFAHSGHIAEWAADQGYAVIATDLPLHGDLHDPGRRPGSDQRVFFNLSSETNGGLAYDFRVHDMLFFNPVNPGAARDNARQALVDTAVLLQLLGQTDFSSATIQEGDALLLAPYVGRTSPRFDTSHSLLFGHSQGSQSLAVQAALDAHVVGAVLSHCGGDYASDLLLRTQPFSMRLVLQALFGTSATELNALHPLMSLVQAIADATDPQSYARFYREPRLGLRPQNILQVISTSDSLSPLANAESLAAAMQAIQLLPEAFAKKSLLPLPSSLGPIKANNGQTATLAFIELEPPHLDQFVLLNNARAKMVVEKFFASVKTRGTAEIVYEPAPTF